MLTGGFGVSRPRGLSAPPSFLVVEAASDDSSFLFPLSLLSSGAGAFTTRPGKTLLSLATLVSHDYSPLYI